MPFAHQVQILIRKGGKGGESATEAYYKQKSVVFTNDLAT